MSPEPPDFPDDMQTVQPAPPRRSGALVFAVTGLAVLALALPLVFSGRDPEVGSSPTTMVVDSTSTTTGSTSTTQSPVLPDQRVVLGWPIFLVQEETEPSGNPGLVAFNLMLQEGSDPDLADQFLAPENVLFALGDLPVEMPVGFASVVPDDVEIVGKTFERTEEGLTRVVLDMNRAFLDGAGGLLADVTMLNQIIFTTLQFEVAEVRFTVDGEPVEAYGLEGISLVDPVDTRSFIDELSAIIVTQPILIDGDLVVRGWANVYEATVSWQITSGDGALPAHSGHVTASCGTGCWGSFEVIEDLSGWAGDRGSFELWLYTESPNDGEFTDLLRIPLSSVPSHS